MNKISPEYNHAAKGRHTLNYPINFENSKSTYRVTPILSTEKHDWVSRGVCTQSLNILHTPSACSLVFTGPWLLVLFQGCPLADFASPSNKTGLSEQLGATSHSGMWRRAVLEKGSCLRGFALRCLWGNELNRPQWSGRTHLGSLVTHSAWLGPEHVRTWLIPTLKSF